MIGSEDRGLDVKLTLVSVELERVRLDSLDEFVVVEEDVEPFDVTLVVPSELV